MIFSIGYARLRDALQLKRIAEHLDAVVIDVRSVPTSRKAGFGRNQLAELLGGRYQWRGNVLGGRIGTGRGAAATIPAEALTQLKQEFAGRKPPHGLLMCLEENPCDCHRHSAIAVRMKVPVIHLCDGEALYAHDIQRAQEKNDDPYLVKWPFDGPGYP